MTTHHPPKHDSGATDSVAPSPLSDHQSNNPTYDDNTTQPCVRFMCSFDGKILPRPHDNQLRYVGGDTRIITVHRHTTFSSLLNKLSKLSGTTDMSVKYQLPNEELDALITVTSDEDVENMMEEYDRLPNNHKTARLRLFLFPIDGLSRASSISSLLHGSTKREHWFLDALNGEATLERGKSEVSSIVSEIPDYLFGLDNADDPLRDPKPKTRLVNDNVSVSDPGSPAPVVSSPFCSTSSASLPLIPDLRPVKVRLDNPAPAVERNETVAESVMETGETAISNQTDYTGQTTWHYIRGAPYPMPAVQNMPIYYIPGSIPTGNVPIQSVPFRSQYVQPFQPPPGHMPLGLNQQVQTMGQMYGGVRPNLAGDSYEMSGRLGEGMNQPVYYGVSNSVQQYPGMMVTSPEETQGPWFEANMGRVHQPP